MRLGKVFRMPRHGGYLGSYVRHVCGAPDVRLNSPSLGEPIKTRRGWCYFRLATVAEVAEHHREQEISRLRQEQAAEERERAKNGASS